MISASLRYSLFAVFILTLLPVPVHADAEEDAHRYEVDVRGFPVALVRPAATQPPVVAEASWSRFQDRHPGWTARWSEVTGKPLRGAGPGIPLPQVPATPAQADQAARAFLTQEAGPWVETGEIELLRAAQDRNGWWVQYKQTYRGLRVVGGRAFARISKAGTVPLFGLDLQPKVEADTNPRLNDAAARSAALNGFPQETTAQTRSTELVILPVSRNGGTDFRTAYEIDFTTREPFGAWVAHVDAHTGDLLWRQSLLHSIDLTGSVSAAIETLTQGDSLEVRALRHATVSLSDSSLIADTVTDVAGNFLIEAPNGGPHTLETELSGPFGYVSNLTFGDTPHLEWDFDPDSTTSFPIVWNDGNSRPQDRDAFYWAMRTHDFIQGVDPTFTLLDYPMYILTDFPDASCNAFWDGYGIAFLAQGGICANMARISSVVIHEYGHGITDFQYRPFYPSSEMHEGFSDYTSATLLDDPRIGVGFFGPGTVLRNVDNDLHYPEDASSSPHATGLIVAGALWDVREVLGPGAADPLWHFARNGFSDNFDDYFFDYLLTDDEDGNVYNGTPHFDAIVPAFRRHGIGDYGIHVSHVPLRDTENANQTFTLTASFLSIFAIQDTSVTLHLAIDWGDGPIIEETRPLMPTGGVREYATVLEAQLEETVVSYWFTAQDTAGTHVTYPPQGAEDPFRFRIGTDTTPPNIVHDALRDQPVDAPRVVFRALVTDNLDKGVDTVRVTHSRDNGAEEVAILFPAGNDFYLTSASWPLYQIGQMIRYRIQVADSAAVPNVASFPDTGWSMFQVVRGLGRDFEDDNGGLSADGDWEWGSPEPYLQAFSGQKVWGTNLSGTYSENALASLIVGPVDLTDFATAGLYFRNFFDTEEYFDGGAAFASTDSGDTWELLVPDGEYPFPELYSSGEPGYSGKSDGWTEAAFPLDAYAGTPDLLLKLEFQSDEAVGGLGWYVDDLEVVERQVLSRPLDLTSQSGFDGEVPLSWRAPAGIDPDAPDTPLLGYHVYRGLPGDNPVRLTSLPLPSPEFVDTTPQNGVFYEYSVRAVYGDGESLPSNTVEAIPYLAALFAEPESLDVISPQGQPANAALHLANTGTGFLKVNIWPTESGQALEDARIRYRVKAGTGFVEARNPWQSTTKEPRPIAPPGDWDLVYQDPEDHADPSIPDLDSVELQVAYDSIYLRLTGHRPWGDPTTQWTLLASFDVDLDPETNPLGDYMLVVGAAAVNAFGSSAVLLDHMNRRVGPVHHSLFPSPNVMEFGFFQVSIEAPDEVFLTVRAMDAPADTTVDVAPSAAELPWLTPNHHRIVLFQGVEQDVQLEFAALPEGNYEGQILIETNDPARPSTVLPVTYTVGSQVPIDLLSFRGQADDLGVRLHWTTSDEADHPVFQVLRSETRGGEETFLTPTPLGGEHGAYAFEDRSVIDGHDYWYRLRETSRTGDARFHGPIMVHYEGVAGLTAVALRPSTPNPMRSTAFIRFGLPAESIVSLRVYSVDGRLVRVLADRVPYPRGFHELAWDGRDKDGRSVHAGVFPYLLDSGGAMRRGKITVLR